MCGVVLAVLWLSGGRWVHRVIFGACILDPGGAGKMGFPKSQRHRYGYGHEWPLCFYNIASYKMLSLSN